MQKRSNIANQIGNMHAASPAGFAVALHITYATPTFLFQSYPKEWMEEYSARGLHLQDPTVAWGFSHSGVIRWSDLAAEDAAGIFELAAGFGIRYGITVAVMQDGTRTVASFARSDREFTDAEMKSFEEAVTRLHKETAGTEALSQADRDALKDMSIRLTHA